MITQWGLACFCGIRHALVQGLGPSVLRSHKKIGTFHMRVHGIGYEKTTTKSCMVIKLDVRQICTFDHNVFAINSDPRLSQQLLRLSRVFFITINKLRGLLKLECQCPRFASFAVPPPKKKKIRRFAVQSHSISHTAVVVRPTTKFR